MSWAQKRKHVRKHSDCMQKVPKLIVFFGQCSAAAKAVHNSLAVDRGEAPKSRKNGKRGQGMVVMENGGKGERTGWK